MSNELDLKTTLNAVQRTITRALLSRRQPGARVVSNEMDMMTNFPYPPQLVFGAHFRALQEGSPAPLSEIASDKRRTLGLEQTSWVRRQCTAIFIA